MSLAVSKTHQEHVLAGMTADDLSNVDNKGQKSAESPQTHFYAMSADSECEVACKTSWREQGHDKLAPRKRHISMGTESAASDPDERLTSVSTCKAAVDLRGRQHD